MADAQNKLSGVLEDDVHNISLSLIGSPPDVMERAAANVIVLSRQGADERRALAEEGVIHSLTIMCSREFGAKTQSKGALALGALCSNYSSNMDDSKLYVYAAAQQEALHRGAVTLITPILTSWQPDAQAAAANALADLCFRNAEVRKAMLNMEACRPLVNLLYSENIDVHKAALAALRAYSVEAKFAREVEDRGALSQACKLVDSDKPDVVARALALLWMLAGADSTKTKIAKERDGAILKNVVAHVKSADSSVKAMAIALLRKLSTIPDHRQELFDLGAHMELVNALRSEDEQVQLNSMGAIRALASAKEESRSVVANAGDLLPTLQRLKAPPKGAGGRIRQRHALATRAQQLLQMLEA